MKAAEMGKRKFDTMEEVKIAKAINWLELPPDLTYSILRRLHLDVIQENAQKVCRSWRRVCKDPSMWRKIDMRNIKHLDFDRNEVRCRRAVDLSQGGLLEINMVCFSSDDLLTYVAQRSSHLRCLGVEISNKLSWEGLVNAIMKFPFLEVLEIFNLLRTEGDLKAIGLCCPLLKTLKLTRRLCLKPWQERGCDNEALAVAETMPELRCLKLYGNALTNTGLKAILDSCVHLEHLDLRRCAKINLSGDLEKLCYERIKDVMRDLPCNASNSENISVDESENESAVDDLSDDSDDLSDMDDLE